MLNRDAIPAKDHLSLRSVLNFRDIGGIAISGGKQFRKKLIFRSANPDNINRGDISRLHGLGIRTIIDLRAPDESKNKRKKIDGIETISLPLDFERVTRERLIPYFYRKNSHEIIADISNSIYLEILDATVPLFRQLVEIILSPERIPVLIHCQAGKDRTGIICSLIHMSAGTGREEIIHDFMLSNEALIPYYRRKLMKRKILTLGFFPADRVLYAITVRQRNIESVMDRVEFYYGGIEGYLDHSGINMAQLDKLKERLVSV